MPRADFSYRQYATITMLGTMEVPAEVVAEGRGAIEAYIWENYDGDNAEREYTDYEEWADDSLHIQDLEGGLPEREPRLRRGNMDPPPCPPPPLTPMGQVEALVDEVRAWA